MPVTACPLCTSPALTLALDLGFHPLADTFLKKEQLQEPEERYPLQVLMCSACGHAMNSYAVSAEKRYQAHDYSYDSGNSKVSIEHFAEMAKDIIARIQVSKEDLVVDIGSSVGTLLQAFSDQSGSRIVGVEPAGNIFALAKEKGVPTHHAFWSDAVVDEILKEGPAKVITATNAFNHISYLDSFMTSIVRALSPDGAFVVEVPYLAHLVEKLAFDTIYLEHVSYFAVKPLSQYVKKFGLSITDLQENEYMGGSLRITMRPQAEESAQVAEYIAREERMGLYSLETYRTMMTRIQQFKRTLLRQLLDAREGGGGVVGIGAATKGNTLLNYCGIDTTLLDCVTDASPLKIHKYTPGSHIPILPDEAITDTVTHALILPWNIAEFLKTKLAPKYPNITFITPHMEQ